MGKGLSKFFVEFPAEGGRRDSQGEMKPGSPGAGTSQISSLRPGCPSLSCERAEPWMLPRVFPARCIAIREGSVFSGPLERLKHKPSSELTCQSLAPLPPGPASQHVSQHSRPPSSEHPRLIDLCRVMGYSGGMPRGNPSYACGLPSI